MLIFSRLSYAFTRREFSGSLPVDEPSGKNVVFLSAAEASGDSHCGGLISALRQRRSDIEFVGVGGPQMAAAGCTLLDNPVQRATMIYHAFGQVGYFYKLLRRVRRFLNEKKCPLVVVCDSPSFNWHVAKAAHKAGTGTLFYVAPQLWAWAPWRIGKLRKRCDRLACILPFEEKWFGERGLKAEFVGNPLLEGSGPAAGAKNYEQFDPDRATVALLPGSREAEIEKIWPAMQQVALTLKQHYKHIRFTAVGVDDPAVERLRSRQMVGLDCDYEAGSLREVVGRSDLALVASGSATLQVAAAGCPMVVMYQSSRLLWHLAGRWLIRTQHLSLVNILAGRRLVPEFMPYFKSTDSIVAECRRLLNDKRRLAEISGELVALARPLATKQASQEVAAMVCEMLDAADEKAHYRASAEHTIPSTDT